MLSEISSMISFYLSAYHLMFSDFLLFLLSYFPSSSLYSYYLSSYYYTFSLNSSSSTSSILPISSRYLTDTDDDLTITETSQLVNTFYINIITFFILLVLFEILRKNSVLFLNRYKKRLINLNRVPTKPSSSLFSWIPLIFFISDDEILTMVGLDGYMLLRYISICLRISSFFSFFGIAILLPIYYTGDNNLTGWNRLTIANVSGNNNSLWAVVLCTYLFVLFFCQIFYIEYKNFIEKRIQYLVEGDPDTHMQTYYTVMIEYLPSSLRSIPILEDFFNRLFPGEIYSIEIALELKDLEDLTKYRRDIQNKLEKAIAYYEATSIRPKIWLNKNFYDEFNKENELNKVKLKKYYRNIDENDEKEQEFLRNSEEKNKSQQSNQESSSNVKIEPISYKGNAFLDFFNIKVYDSISHYSLLLDALNLNVLELQTEYYKRQRELNEYNQSRLGEIRNNIAKRALEVSKLHFIGVLESLRSNSSSQKSMREYDNTFVSPYQSTETENIMEEGEIEREIRESMKYIHPRENSQDLSAIEEGFEDEEEERIRKEDNTTEKNSEKNKNLLSEVQSPFYEQKDKKKSTNKVRFNDEIKGKKSSSTSSSSSDSSIPPAADSSALILAPSATDGNASAPSSCPTSRSNSRNVSSEGHGLLTNQLGALRTGVEGIAKEGLKSAEVATKSALRGVLEATRALELLTFGAYYKISSTAFVTFKSRIASASAQQMLLSHDYDTLRVIPAPNPEDIIWENVSIPKKQINMRKSISQVTLVVGAIFWSIVVAFISAISNLESISEEIPSLKKYSDSDIYKFLNNYLAVLLLLILLSLLPFLFDFISRNYEGLKTESEIQNSIMTRYFYYQLANVFVSVGLGSIATSLHSILNHPSSIMSILGNSVPTFSIYFANLIITRTFTGIPIEMLRIFPSLSYYSTTLLNDKKKCTRRELKLGIFADPPIAYGFVYPNILMVIMIMVTYCCISPLILPLSFTFFVFSYFLYKYQLVYVFVNNYQSGGFMWYAVFDRSMLALLCGSTTLLCYFAIKPSSSSSNQSNLSNANESSGPFYALLPIPFLIFFFWMLCSKRFTKGVTTKVLSIERAREFDRIVKKNKKKNLKTPLDSFKKNLFRQPSLCEGRLKPAPYRINCKRTLEDYLNFDPENPISIVPPPSNASSRNISADANQSTLATSNVPFSLTDLEQGQINKDEEKDHDSEEEKHPEQTKHQLIDSLFSFFKDNSIRRHREASITRLSTGSISFLNHDIGDLGEDEEEFIEDFSSNLNEEYDAERKRQKNLSASSSSSSSSSNPLNNLIQDKEYFSNSSDDDAKIHSDSDEDYENEEKYYDNIKRKLSSESNPILEDRDSFHYGSVDDSKNFQFKLKNLSPTNKDKKI